MVWNLIAGSALFLGVSINVGLKVYRNFVLLNNPNYLSQLNKGLNYPGGFMKNMSINEALLVLGLENKNYKKEEIYKAYIKQISLNHPDRKGSLYLSMKINEARDILIDK